MKLGRVVEEIVQKGWSTCLAYGKAEHTGNDPENQAWSSLSVPLGVAHLPANIRNIN